MSDESLASYEKIEAEKALASSQWLGLCVSTAPFTVKRLDEADVDARPYSKASNYTATIGDLVVMRRISYPGGPWYGAHAIV